MSALAGRTKLPLVAACVVLAFAAGLVVDGRQARTQSPLAAPTIDSVDHGDGSLTVSWSAPAGVTGITNYDLRHIASDATDKADANWTTLSEVWAGSGALTATVDGLTNGTSYDVQVRAFTTEAGSWSSTETGTPRVPGPKVTLGLAGDTTITIEWDEPAVSDATEITAYDVRYIETGEDTTDDSNWTVVAEAWTSGPLRYLLTGLTNGTSYGVQVRAVAGTDAAWSATSTVSPAEHGDERSTATSLPLGTQIGGVIDDGNDVDFFTIVLTERTDLIIYTRGDLDTVGEVFNSGGAPVVVGDDSRLVFGHHNFLIVESFAAGTYFIKVTSAEEATGDYILQTRAIKDTTGRADAFPLELNDFNNGILAGSEVDYFRFSLPERTTVLVRFNTSIFFSIRDADDEWIATRSVPGLASTRRVTLDRGVYYIRVADSSSAPLLYSVYLSAISEPGSTRADAVPVPFRRPVGGTIDPTGDTDYFRIDLDDATWVEVLVVGLDIELDAELLDSGGSPVDANLFEYNYSFFSSGGLRGIRLLDRIDAGTHYLKVSRLSDNRYDSVGPYVVVMLEDLDYSLFIDECEGLTALVSDPLSGCQWHLKNTGQLDGTTGEDINIEGAWLVTQGAGSTIAIVDNGMDYEHEDLSANVDTSKNHDYTGNDDIFYERHWHGTGMAGIAAARDNSIGIRGVAPRATIYGFNLLRHSSDANTADALTREMDTTAVSNNSWGYLASGGVSPTPRVWELAMDRAIAEGYGGKGVFFAWSAGNGGRTGDNANFEGYLTHHGSVAVCSVDDTGVRVPTSEKGANLWLCAPSLGVDRAGITTTDNYSRYRGDSSGTSSSAPQVAGVAALLRSANTSLTWRDLKLILAASARKNDPDNAGWEEGALRYGSSTDRYSFNHEYGFGVLDATAALTLATGWTNLPPMLDATASWNRTPAWIPVNRPLTTTVTMGSDVDFIEFIEITIDFETDEFRPLKVELESPSGAISLLAPSREVTAGLFQGCGFFGIFDCPLSEPYRFASAKHLGESSEGVWTLRVTDTRASGAASLLQGWSITFYGHRSTPAAPVIDSLTSGSTSLTVAWSAPENVGKAAVTAYDLRYILSDATNRADDQWTLVEDVWTTGGGALSHTISSLTEDELYDIQVRGVNSEGDGLWSPHSTGIAEPTAAPTIDSLTPGDQSITVAWSAPSPGAGITSYDLRYIRSDATNKADRRWTTATGVWRTGGGDLEYTLDPRPTRLLNGVSYQVQVRAVTGSDAGAWSAIHSAIPRTVPGAFSVSVEGDDFDPCCDESLELTWQAPSGDGGAAITSYDLRYILATANPNVEGNWSVVTGVWTSGNRRYTLTGLANGTSYRVQMRAVNAAGAGPWSASREGTPQTTPDAPTIDSVTGGYRTIRVRWSAPADDGGDHVWSYGVRYIRSDATDKDDEHWELDYFYAGTEDRDPIPLDHTISDLESGVSYDVQVSGRNSPGIGDWSSTSTATTSLSGNTNLSALSLSSATLYPRIIDTFVASVAHVDDEVTIVAEPSDPSSTVVIRDSTSAPIADANDVEGHQIALDVGANVIEVFVTAQNGTTRTYTLTVTRAAQDPALTPAATTPIPLQSPSALYDVSFRGAWTIAVTPDGVPLRGQFSGLVAAIHNGRVTFLKEGEEASAGVEALAESGSTTALRREFSAAGVNTASVSQATPSAVSPTSLSTFGNVILTADHPLVTLLAHISPSHDWFVGVSGLPLFNTQGLWLLSHDVDLYPWDAGTEEGAGFFDSPDISTNPRGVIHSIAGDNQFSTEPIATLTFTRRGLGPYFPSSETGTRSVPENTATGQDIGAPVVATDPDSGDTLTYSLGGPDAAAFRIDRSSGQVRTRAALDHEARDAYTVTVVATDTTGLTGEIDVTITVTNVEEPGTASLWPAQPRVDTVLQALLEDADGELRQVIWTWERSADGDNWTAFSVTGESYTPVSTDVGMHIRASVSYADGAGSGKSAETGATQMVAEATPAPDFTIVPLVTSLDTPWDLAVTPDGAMLFTERDGTLSARLPDGTVQEVMADFSDLYVSGEAGLMGVVVDPRFTSNRRFYTCQTHTGPTAQVIAWVVSADYTEAARIDDPLVGDIPAGPRNSGCRLHFGPRGYLWIATGDAAAGTAPQDVDSLGGKVLRVDASTGEAAPGNPFSSLVYTYGHRNVQGLALRPRTQQMWAIEQGPSLDDEINLLTSGGNYGWNPVPGYNESAPMTDLSTYPSAVEARWSSGDPTLGTSGGVFLNGSDWGPWNGRLAVATLTGQSLRIFEFTSRGDFVSQVVVPEFDNAFGRLRTAVLGPDGALYLTTSDGSNDRILKVAPSLPPAFPTATETHEVAENSPASTVIATVTASDPERGRLTYTLGGPDAGSFNLASATSGQVRANAPLDFETQNSYEVVVTASDPYGLTDSVTLTINVTAENEPPVLSGNSVEVYDENGTAPVARYTADDPEGEPVTWSLLGPDAAEFELSGGVLTFRASPDYEERTSYRVTLMAADPHGLAGSLSVSIEIADVDEPPVVSGNADITYAENGTSPVETYTAADPEGETIVWSLLGTDRDAFRITNGGALRFVAPPDYETGGDNEYLVTVVASDGSQSASYSVTVNVTDVNEPPEITSGPAAVTHEENGGSTVATYSATDPDSGDSITWLLQGRDASVFTISGGALSFLTPPDYEARSSYSVVVAVSDGEDAAGDPEASPTADDTVTVTVTIGVNEAPTVSGPASVTYVENATTPVAAYRADDPERGSIEWSLGGSDAGAFAISDGGELTFREPPDHETRDSYQVTVTATDPLGLSDSVSVTVTVTDANEPPELTGPVNVRFQENGTGAVASYSATDPDSGDTPVWLVSGRDAAAFPLQGGTLRFVSPPDREAKASYEVVVGVGDGEDAAGSPEGTPTADTSLSVTIAIANVDEPPVFASGPERVDYAEHATVAVGTYRATDPEGVPTLWRLSGPDAEDFSIDINGVLTFGTPPDYEDPRGAAGNEYRVTVNASDGATTASRGVVVNVGNTDEPGTLALSSEQPQVGTQFTATLDEPDGSLGSQVWTWERSPDGRSWTAITSAVSGTYQPAGADLNHYLRATVAYEDGHGPGKTAQARAGDRVRAHPTSNSAPAFVGLRPRREVAENAQPGTPLGDRIAFSDADDDPLVYALTGGGSDLFTIDRATGQIAVASGARLDHETSPAYSLTVTASDPSNTTGSVAVTVTVTDVNEPPVAVADTVSTSEDTAVAIDVLANDDDPEDDALTVSVTAAPRNGAARVEAGNAITYSPNPDFHGVDVFTYTVSDGRGSSVATVAVTVTAVNDAPVFPTRSTDLGVPAGAKPGASVGTPIAATDPDGDIPEYSLSGPDEDSFDIDGNSGQITVADGAEIDPETQALYTVIVTATDASGASSTLSVTITVGGASVSFVGIGGGGGGGPSGPTPSEVEFEWNVKRDIEALDSEHGSPSGAWSDGTTFWLAENGDGADDAIYAYDIETGERLEDREFDLDERNRAPRGIWSDGVTLWVSDSGRDRLFAYDLTTGERLPDSDIDLAAANRDVRGIWSDGATLWVLDSSPDALYAYDLATRELLAWYALDARQSDPRGLWSDGVSLWVSDAGSSPRRLFAYRVPALPAEGTPLPEEPLPLERIVDEEFEELSSASNNSPRGIWSDGDVMYVADESDGRVYTYNMPDAIDARLASLTLSGVEIGQFDPATTDYEGVPGEGVTQTTVVAEAMQRRTTVVIDPPDAAEGTQGHQVSLTGVPDVTVTVTSQDGLRMRVYRVTLGGPGLEFALEPGWTAIDWPGADGAALAEMLPDGVVAVYAWDEAAGTWLAYFPAIADVPGLNTLTAFSTGQMYWVAVTEPVTWTVPGIGTAP